MEFELKLPKDTYDEIADIPIDFLDITSVDIPSIVLELI